VQDPYGTFASAIPWIPVSLLVSISQADPKSPKCAEAAEDPQTLRMVAGAIANLCGNEKVQHQLRDEGGLRALLNMAATQHTEVLAQVCSILLPGTGF
jgi:hypothetical protein